jgi:hypothetical protein
VEFGLKGLEVIYMVYWMSDKSVYWSVIAGVVAAVVVCPAALLISRVCMIYAAS